MKKILLLMLSIVISLTAMAQAITMTIDNQTPGWLSSKINYGDQQTVVNLTVSGYLNGTDLTFIGQLMRKQSLKGILDLSDAKIVGENDEDGNLDVSQYSMTGSLKHLLAPKDLKKLNIGWQLELDTLTFPAWSTINGSLSSTAQHVKVLEFREGLSKIDDHQFFDGGSDVEVLHTIKLPSSVRYIGHRSFSGCNSLKKINLNDSISFIGGYAFERTQAFDDTDTIKLPKSLKTYYIQSLKYPFSKDLTVYIPNSVSLIRSGYGYDTFSGTSITSSLINIKGNTKIYCHLTNINPPDLNISYYVNESSNNEKILKEHFVFYVPRNALSNYKNDSKWKNYNIQEDSTCAYSVNLSEKEVKISKHQQKQLFASIFPSNAYTQDLIWYTSDSSVVKISKNAFLESVSPGNAYIYVCVKDIPTLKDSCKVIVSPSVKEIALDESDKEIKVGESFSLKVTISPSDADNKTVSWKSENNAIASVEKGKVVGVKAGTAKITAISASDTTVCASCNVKVLQPVEGIFIDKNSCEMKGIGDTIQLTAIVSPDDASNKAVNWKSSDEKVCMVSNGKVVAVGLGTAVVIATSADGGYMATCTVTVTNTSGISDVYIDKSSQFKIYRIDGKQINKLQKGFNIIKFDNGITKRVVIND